jgi:hypothetical protein
MPGGSRPTAWSHCYRPAPRRPPSATWLASRRAADGRNLDEVFEDMFRERTPEELEALKAKYVTKGDVLEAEKLIAAKARDMLRHYVENILPNGFRAQVVAVSSPSSATRCASARSLTVRGSSTATRTSGRSGRTWEKRSARNRPRIQGELAVSPGVQQT